MSQRLQNLLSRKFLLAVLSVIVGILYLLGIIPQLPSDEWIDKVVALIGTILSPVIYIITEGQVDKKQAENQAITNAKDLIQGAIGSKSLGE